MAWWHWTVKQRDLSLSQTSNQRCSTTTSTSSSGQNSQTIPNPIKGVHHCTLPCSEELPATSVKSVIAAQAYDCWIPSFHRCKSAEEVYLLLSLKGWGGVSLQPMKEEPDDSLQALVDSCLSFVKPADKKKSDGYRTGSLSVSVQRLAHSMLQDA